VHIPEKRRFRSIPVNNNGSHLVTFATTGVDGVFNQLPCQIRMQPFYRNDIPR
jgi:hypothetical protein